jgi:taurine dioxygenase
MSANSVDKIEVIPSGAGCGAEIRGIDLPQEMPPDVLDRFSEIWGEHLVVLLRDQHLCDDDLIRFSNYYGGQQAGGARMRRWKIGMKDQGDFQSTDARINYVSNVDATGKPDPKPRGTGNNELRWHSDNTYVEIPPTATLLWAEIVPDDDSGQTMFCNQVRAYEELPDDLKSFVEGKHMMHDGSRNTANLTHPDKVAPKTRDEIDGPIHPIVRIHPLSGKRALFLGRRWDYPSTYIVEKPDEEGEEIMDRLWAHATQEKYVWVHHWKPNDFVLWDNRAVMHRRTAINPKKPRVLHRTLIKGDPVIAAWEETAAAE